MNKKLALIFSLSFIAINTISGSMLYQGSRSSSNLSGNSVNSGFSLTTPALENLDILTDEHANLASLVTHLVIIPPQKRRSWGNSIGRFVKSCRNIGGILLVSCVALFTGGIIVDEKMDNGLTENQNPNDISSFDSCPFPFMHNSSYSEFIIGVSNEYENYIFIGVNTISEGTFSSDEGVLFFLFEETVCKSQRLGGVKPFYAKFRDI